MTETLIGGLLALAGVIIGGLSSFLLEVWRNKKSVSERKYQRKKEIVDKRCDQAESFVQAMTDDFQTVMYNTKILLAEDEESARNHLSKIKERTTERTDFRIFSLGPTINALSDNDLKEDYQAMLKSLEELKASIKNALEIRAKDQPIDVSKIYKQLDELWIEYSKYLGRFYSRINEIRYKLSEE